jgi:hypothetical protein
MVVLIVTFFIGHSFRLRVWPNTTNSEMGHLRTGINCAISLMGQQPLGSCGTPAHNPLLPLHIATGTSICHPQSWIYLSLIHVLDKCHEIKGRERGTHLQCSHRGATSVQPQVQTFLNWLRKG